MIVLYSLSKGEKCSEQKEKKRETQMMVKKGLYLPNLYTMV